MKQEEFYLNQLDRECIKIPGKDGKYLLRNNFLNEYYTNKDKAKVLSNLGITPLLERLEALVEAKLVDNAGNLRFGLKPTSYREDPNALIEVLSSDTIYNSLQQYYTKEEIDEWRERVFDTINLLRNSINNSVDDNLGNSTNPVQNWVLFQKFKEIEDKLKLDYVKKYYLIEDYYNKTQVQQLLGQLRNYIDQKFQECCEGGGSGGGSTTPDNEVIVTINLDSPKDILLYNSNNNIAAIEVDEVPLYVGDSITVNLDSGQHIIKYTLTDPTIIPEHMLDNTFTNCESASILIPPQVTSIGYEAFSKCKFTSITVDSDNIVYDSRNNCNAIIETQTNTLILGSINTIIPDTVTSIGISAFRSQSNIAEITIPNNIINIGNNAFRGCTGLTSIIVEGTIPPTIGTNVFAQSTCPIYVPCASVDTYKSNWLTYANRIQCLSSDIIATYQVTNTNTPVLLYGYDEIASSPDEVFSKIIVDDVEISIPNLISANGEYNFSTIGEHTVIYTLINPTATTDSTFHYCENLKKVILPSTLKVLEEDTFASCINLREVQMPNSVTEIGSYAFSGCRNLEIINIPEKLITIQAYAFENCVDLSGWWVFGNHLQTISDSAFNGAFHDDVTSINLPSTITEIDSHAFYECWSLNSITVNATVPPTLGEHAFDDIDQDFGINVPEESVDLYKNAEGWSTYASHIHAIQS